MIRIIRSLLVAALACVALTACNDRQSYAELLRDQNEATNYYLSNFQVINEVPADSVFISVADLMDQGLSRTDALKLAPFYRLDESGDVYMQVVRPGDEGKAVENQLIYFRFNRYNLSYYYSSGEWYSDGNATDLGTEPTSFRFENYTLESSYQWGSGIQLPLRYMELGSEINVVIKSTVGLVNEQSSVIPYLYTVRYYPSRV